jgi:hypothetical protein
MDANQHEISLCIFTCFSPKNGEHRDRIGGRDEGAKMEVVDEGDVAEVGEHLTHAVHEAAHREGGDRRPHEGEGEDGAEVAEEVAALHSIAGVEDDGREEDVEEELGVKDRLGVDLALRDVHHLA